MKIPPALKIWSLLLAAVAMQPARADEAPQAAAAKSGQSQTQTQSTTTVQPDGQSQTQSSGQVQVQADGVQVQADGFQVQADGDGTVVTKTIVVRVGPDGKIEIKDAIPDDVKQKMKEARETAERQAAEIEQDVKRKIAAAEEQAREATRREPQQLQSVPATGFGMQGSITVIGPDGVKRTQTFGSDGGTVPGLQQLLEKSLEAAGADLPDEVRRRLDEAFRRQGPNQADEQGQRPQKNTSQEVSRKLDLILERLEKLEQAMSGLQATRPAEKP